MTLSVPTAANSAASSSTVNFNTIVVSTTSEAAEKGKLALVPGKAEGRYRLVSYGENTRELKQATWITEAQGIYDIVKGALSASFERIIGRATEACREVLRIVESRKNMPTPMSPRVEDAPPVGSKGLSGAQGLPVTIVDHAALVNGNPEAIEQIKQALNSHGIVGIRGVPGYRQLATEVTKAFREFSALPLADRQDYAPQSSFYGYSKGIEQFTNAAGKWVVDHDKASYYFGAVPESRDNVWPADEVLKNAATEMGRLMHQTGQEVLRAINVLREDSGISVGELGSVGRLLHYSKDVDHQVSSDEGNPYWCGEHKDHGCFTALMKDSYFKNGVQVEGPKEAGLFVKVPGENQFRKVVTTEEDVMLFQVGEAAQLGSDDKAIATPHRVERSNDEAVERFTMALFMNPHMDAKMHSYSTLTADSRFGDDETCTFADWHAASMARYAVPKEETVGGASSSSS